MTPTLIEVINKVLDERAQLCLGSSQPGVAQHTGPGNCGQREEDLACGGKEPSPLEPRHSSQKTR